jgi:hypothetical protein
MKHLKKLIIESSTEKIDVEYIEMCFIDLIESERFRKLERFGRDTLIDLSFNVPMPEVKNFANSYFKDITPFTTCGYETQKLYLDVEECVKKVKIEYPDYNIEYKQFIQGFVPNVFVIRFTLKTY